MPKAGMLVQMDSSQHQWLPDIPRLFQDRLIKEMGLAEIEDYDGANKFFLEKFLPWRNEKYTHPAESSYIALPYGINLDTIFCNRLERTVKRK